MAIFTNATGISCSDKSRALTKKEDDGAIIMAEKLNTVYVCHECLNISIFKSDIML